MSYYTTPEYIHRNNAKAQAQRLADEKKINVAIIKICYGTQVPYYEITAWENAANYIDCLKTEKGPNFIIYLYSVVCPEDPGRRALENSADHSADCRCRYCLFGVEALPANEY